MKATHNDSGTWSCHMGSAHVTVIDRVKEIAVRITGTAGIRKTRRIPNEGCNNEVLISICRNIIGFNISIS